MNSFLLALIGFYQRAISPAFPSFCKFHPTCSAYTAEAIQTYGPARGIRMATGRLLRCRPFSPGGYDPVC